MRTEAAAAAGGGGGEVGAGWDLSAEAGLGPGLGGGRSSDPGSVRRRRREKKDRVRNGRSRRGTEEPAPPARVSSLAERLRGTGILPQARTASLSLSFTGGMGELGGERTSASSRSLNYTKGRNHPAGTAEPPVCSPSRERGEGKKKALGEVTAASRAASPCVRSPA